MNFDRTKRYYEKLNIKDLCQCGYCLNYYKQVEKEYPDLIDYFALLGIDIRKPFETIPLEVDDKGYIDYIGSQYIVFGSNIDFKSTIVNETRIDIVETHPSTEISEEHFVIEIEPIKLRWVIENCDNKEV